MISEPVLIRLFCNSLRSSIRAQTKQKICQKDNWKQTIRKAITTKAKAALNLPFWVRKMDACCPRGHRSASKPIEDHTRDQSSLLFRSHKARAMLPHHSKPTKTKKPCRDHQNGKRNRNCCNCDPCSSRSQDSTSVTGVNTTKTPA